MSLVITLERAFSAKGMFEHFIDHDRVEHGFTGQHAGFTEVIVRFEAS